MILSELLRNSEKLKLHNFSSLDDYAMLLFFWKFEFKYLQTLL